MVALDRTAEHAVGVVLAAKGQADLAISVVKSSIAAKKFATASSSASRVSTVHVTWRAGVTPTRSSRVACS